METIANKLRSFRTVNRLSKADLARVLGVTRMSVALWESGAHTPSTSNLVKINAIMNHWFKEPQTAELKSEPKSEPKQELIPKQKAEVTPTLKSLTDRAEQLKAELRQVEALIEAYRAGMAEAASQARWSNYDNQLTT